MRNFGGNSYNQAARAPKSKCYSTFVKPLDTEREFELGNVVVVKQIPVTASCRNVRNDLKRFDHLKDVMLPEIPNATVTLLIGNDNYLAQFPLKVRVVQTPPHVR